jgi:hypothetical protein
MTITDPAQDRPLDRRARAAHPKTLNIGGEDFDRNDVAAEQLGECERTLNRRDRQGAPFIFLGGIKYRPRQRLADYLLGTIKAKKTKGRK